MFRPLKTGPLGRRTRRLNNPRQRNRTLIMNEGTLLRHLITVTLERRKLNVRLVRRRVRRFLPNLITRRGPLPTRKNARMTRRRINGTISMIRTTRTKKNRSVLRLINFRTRRKRNFNKPIFILRIRPGILRRLMISSNV